ncbi:HpcH/HpaI aldolase/citrate lyase family protein [Kushneria phosphatilytica]|nr:aldolase/citrate lyase family protein [Kushneria phosphatilytica]OHV07627.1 hypothetical protein BH688_15590 [Kushneria phosphatilytica]
MNVETDSCPRKAARSALLVSAVRSDRVEKALAGRADMVIVDLGSPVPTADRQASREALARVLHEHPGTPLAVRVSPPDTPEHDEDLLFCQRFEAISTVVVPGIDSIASLVSVAALGRPIWPLIDSAAGLGALREIASADGVERLGFGAQELALDLDMAVGTSGGESLLDQARFALIMQSRLAGLLAPLAEVSPIIGDSEALRATARRALDMGFGGMLCSHPAQPGPINEAFTPSSAQLDWARRVLADADTIDFMVDGEPISASLIHRAKRLVARSGSVRKTSPSSP